MFHFFSAKAALLLSIFFLACSDKTTDPAPGPGTGEIGQVKLESLQPVIEKTVGPSAMEIEVTDKEQTLYGLTLTTPASAFSSSRDLSIKSAVITSHDFGYDMTILSPLIVIDQGAIYADSLMTLTIPITLPKGHFAMGFLLSAASSSLEAIPVTAIGETSVTLQSRHFGSPPAAESGLQKRTADEAPGFGLFIASMSKSALDGMGVINSGFKPGEADWEFVNEGSYIASGGQCAGQSMTAMWYYVEKYLKGEDALHKQFSTLSNGYDNNRGIRFASVIQEDFRFTQWGRSMVLSDMVPELSWYSFIFSMKKTGEPQSALILSSKGEGGHAMVVYKVDVPGKTLYISDPNFPGNLGRRIAYTDTGFAPYYSALNANRPGVYFDQISFAAKTAYMKWEQVAKRWKEFQDSAIGSVAPNAFPAYTVQMLEKDSAKSLPEGYTTEDDTLLVQVNCPTCERFYAGTTHLQPFAVADSTGKYLALYTGLNRVADKLGALKVPLEPGSNKLGFHILGVKADPDSAQNSIFSYIDFKWIHVVKSGLSIIPGDTTVEINSTLSLKAQYPSAAGVAEYRWTFSDGSDDVSGSDAMVEHTFNKAGICMVTAAAVSADGKPKSADTAYIRVSSGDPFITGFFPDTAFAEDTMSVFGMGFGDRAGFVTLFGDSILEFVLWSDTLVQFVVNDTAQSGWCVIFTADSKNSNAELAEVLVRPPVITRISPAAAGPEDSLTVFGKYFKRKLRNGSMDISVELPVASGSSSDRKLIFTRDMTNWTDSSFSIRLPYNIKSGPVRVLARDTLSNDMPLRALITTDNLIQSRVEVNVDMQITRKFPDTTYWYSAMSLVENFLTGNISGSGSQASIVWDTSYVMVNGVNKTNVEKHRSVVLHLSDSADAVSDFDFSYTEWFENSAGIITENIKHVKQSGPIPLYNITLGINPDSILTYSYQLDSATVCGTIQEIAFKSSSTEEMVDYRCEDKHRIFVSFTRRLKKP